MKGKTVKVSGPLIVADGMEGAKMYDVVRVSKQGLIGEIIEMKGGTASVQVYEETALLGIDEVVISTGEPLCVELAPGLLEGIYDGIQRPLERLLALSGERIKRGVSVSALDREKKWEFNPCVQPGAKLSGGDIIGTVRENEIIEHKVMLPPSLSGTITKIERGSFNITQTVAVLKDAANTEHNIAMLQRWPVRKARPYKQKLTPSAPLVTGQRVIDTLFPIAKGGVAAVPGPFGSGKTVVQHQLAKWSDADIVVYVGCGERGNEMTDVLNEFPHLVDPRSGKPLMKRTILIANTSDMPVAAREASIYTGITIAEYFRDMGYHVAIMADSTSRWAEALREIGGRLEEMPGEEGYPAYLSSRLAEFYERAGMFSLCASTERIGSITAIGAISPPGGDMSEPVSQATLRIVKVFWGLTAALAYKRHFPAIDWLTSYSLYSDRLNEWFDKNADENWSANCREAQRILQEEAKLDEIARLVGVESLSGTDRLIMETAKSIREDFLHQNAFHEIDTYSSLKKQAKILSLILCFHNAALAALGRGVKLQRVLSITSRDDIGRSKYTAEDSLDKFDELEREILRQTAQLNV